LLEDNGVSRPCHVVTCRRGLQEISDIIASGEHPRAAGNDETADRRFGLRRGNRVAHREVHFLRQGVLFSGRRIVIVRADSSSATMMCSVMVFPGIVRPSANGASRQL
jgi:hypothetical protein